MKNEGAKIVVAGHVCLDVIPALPKTGDVGSTLRPGALTTIGEATISTGGPVSNTGLSLHKLGASVGLSGKIGDDEFGELVLRFFQERGESLAERMIVAKGERTSYTIVLSPPGVDRMFLHYPGANDTFEADDVDYDAVPRGGIFHFGYPPIMRKMYERDGEELAATLKRARDRGAVVSLDLATPDPESPAGRADWRTILRKSLPYTDVTLPSADEILFMLKRDRFEKLLATGDVNRSLDAALLREVADELIDYGAAIVGLKLGDQGLYVKTTDDAERLARVADALKLDAAKWLGYEAVAPCFAVEAVGATGAGDATIAGFIFALSRGADPEEATTAATATGACCVERSDSLSGVRSWSEIEKRLTSGWKRAETNASL
jgi:sugar/nucleoside kinase (ribokinase family)